MTTNDFLQRLDYHFSTILPGIDAHKKFTPGKRPLTRAEVSGIEKYRNAAVAIVCFPKDEHIHSILIERPVYDGTHSGQISFPGGKAEENDETIEATARRETFEELGWNLTEAHFIGKLTELFIPVSQFAVQPHLYFVKEEQLFMPDQREVKSIITFDIEDLLDDTKIKSTSIELSHGMKLKAVPYFDIQNKVVWGATAIILSELREMLL